MSNKSWNDDEEGSNLWEEGGIDVRSVCMCSMKFAHTTDMILIRSAR